jgi:hypothetical protein
MAAATLPSGLWIVRRSIAVPLVRLVGANEEAGKVEGNFCQTLNQVPPGFEGEAKGPVGVRDEVVIVFLRRPLFRADWGGFCFGTDGKWGHNVLL